MVLKKNKVKFGKAFEGGVEVSSRRFKAKGKTEEGASSWQEGLMLTSNVGEGKKTKLKKEKTLFLHSLILVFFLLLLARLWYLQVARGEENLILSEGNRIRVQRLVSPRGVIYDRNREILARNTPGFKAILTPGDIPSDEKKKVFEKLSSILGISLEELELFVQERSQNSPFWEIPIKTNLSRDEVLKLEAAERDLPGVHITKDIIRQYEEGVYFSHILGFTNEVTLEELKNPDYSDYTLGDRIGRVGVEEVYEARLKGVEGKSLVEVDAFGRKKRILAEEAPVAGQSLILSLDSFLQKKAGKKLEESLSTYKATAGVVIISDPRTGEILTLLNIPSFDNNLFTSQISQGEYSFLGRDPLKPFLNRAISGLYPPGSTIKPVIAVGALEEGIISEKTKIDDRPGYIQIGPWTFADWTLAWGSPLHGLINVVEAIAQSCDIFFYKIGGGFGEQKGLGIEAIKEYFSLFGLGEISGVDLSGEEKGLIPDPEWKKEIKKEEWYLGNTYHVSIGQGDLLVTPIQINTLTSVFANYGKLLKPHLLQTVFDLQEREIYKREVLIKRENFVSTENIEIVRKGMREAVAHGIIYPLREASVSVAAKTGTAEFGVKNLKGEYETHAWVTGFAPYENPEIVFTVLLEAGGKSNNAAEVAREIIDWYFGN